MYSIENGMKSFIIKEQKLNNIVSCNVEYERLKLFDAMNNGLTFILDRSFAAEMYRSLLDTFWLGGIYWSLLLLLLLFLLLLLLLLLRFQCKILM
jgi:ABC-type multidrug transport system permease subunit